MVDADSEGDARHGQRAFELLGVRAATERVAEVRAKLAVPHAPLFQAIRRYPEYPRTRLSNRSGASNLHRHIATEKARRHRPGGVRLNRRTKPHQQRNSDLHGHGPFQCDEGGAEDLLKPSGHLPSKAGAFAVAAPVSGIEAMGGIWILGVVAICHNAEYIQIVMI